MTRIVRILGILMLVIGMSALADDKAPTQEDLDRLLAPIALYPDDLLAMTLMASTYPLEVVEASRWVEKNKKLTGDALTKEVQKQSWDPSIQSLCRTPDVLKRLNENLEWTQKLGNAFLADQKAVMTTVQSLRKKALDAGNLKSSKEMKVDTNTSTDPAVIVIQSPTPQTVYVPVYNPTVVYGTWWYAYPPYYMYPPSYVYPPGFGFAAGVFVGAVFWGNCNWNHASLYVNVNHYNQVNINSYNKTNISNTNINNVNNNTWSHNAEHRKGVSYPNDKVAQQYNRSSDRAAVASREDFRGKVDSKGVSQMDTAGLKDRASSIDRSGVQNMDKSKAQNNFSGSKENAFSNTGNASHTNAVSNRGSMSHGNMGGGRSGGGGRSFGGRR